MSRHFAERNLVDQREFLFSFFIFKRAVELTREEIAGALAQFENPGRHLMTLLAARVMACQQVLDVRMKQNRISSAFLLGIRAELRQFTPVTHLETPRMDREAQILPMPIFTPEVLCARHVMRVEHPLLVGRLTFATADGHMEMAGATNQFVRSMTDAKHVALLD